MPIVNLYQPSRESWVEINPQQPESVELIMGRLLAHKYTPKIAPANSVQDITPFARAGAKYVLAVGSNPERGMLHMTREGSDAAIEAAIKNRNGLLLSRVALNRVEVGPGLDLVPLLQRKEDSPHAVIGACVLHLTDDVIKNLFGEKFLQEK